MSEAMTPDETENVAQMKTFGRVLKMALEEGESGWRPDLRAREGMLTDEQPESYIVLVSNGSRQWLTPETMAVLAEHGISAEPVERDHWSNPLYAEYRVNIADDVLSVYERAVEAWGVPEPPRNLSETNKQAWTHVNVMAKFDSESDE